MKTLTSIHLLAGVLLFAAVVSVGSTLQAASDDMVIADFERPTYGDWKVTGEAFGPGPARGTLPRQMQVSGYLGQGLVNSFHHGDGSTGTLTSPEFTISRKYLAFLIGGGHHPGQTCINLLVDRKPVRTATGPNKKPGGTERLDPFSWDVSDLFGKRARIEIVDRATGGWGHINIDHLVMTDRRPPRLLANQKHPFSIEKKFLLLPVRNGAPKRWVSVVVGGQAVRECQIELADAEADQYAALDVLPWRGKQVELQVDQLFDSSAFFRSVRQDDTVQEPKNLYHEVYRPQFHFTPRTNWTNDPNGLVYYQGEYHLFFQHNPFGLPWGNMTWGHAVGPDLVHWTELDDAIHPDRLGTIFSGSAVVDWNNTAGFQSGDEKTIVCIYTSAGGTSPSSQGQPFTQSIAYSNDRGRTWTKYAKNPVLGHIVGGNRDPKVVWHEPTKRWILVLFKDKNDFGFFASPDLKTWTHLHDLTVPGSSECPDFFEMPVDGNQNSRRWVFTSAKGDYLIGRFDGRQFTPETGPHPLRWGGNYYAVQSYSDVPKSDGRRIQIAWMAGGRYPGMPFNQQMNFPSELSLRTCPEGLRVYRYPVKEIERLRTRTHVWTDVPLGPQENLLKNLRGDLYDIEAEIEPAGAKEVGFVVFGQKIVYRAADKRLSAAGAEMELAPRAGRVQLRILVDRVTIDAFGNGGRVAICYCFLPETGRLPLELIATGGPAKIVSLKVHELKSTHIQSGGPR